jgi:DNA-binding transcriptional MerR regulator
VRIGELAVRTGISARMLRYYEEQGLLTPERTSSGYRSYPDSAVSQAGQIRGLLDAGLTTEIIRTILPCLNDPEDVRRTVGCLPAATVELIRAELGRVQQRIDCLTRNRDAIEAYLANQRGRRAGRSRNAPPAARRVRGNPCRTVATRHARGLRERPLNR